MPFIDFDKTKKNLGSSFVIIEYLDKENANLKQEERTPFFNHDGEIDDKKKMVELLDSNNKRLMNKEEKYFSFFISPSSNEHKIILESGKPFEDYVRGVMDLYADNFNKGISGNDLLYFAKVEQERRFKNLDPGVKAGYVKNKQLKDGNQMHAHVVVSRRAKNNGPKLSPKEKTKGNGVFYVPGKKDPISRGFDMNGFIERAESLFDAYYGYNRPFEEKFDYLRLKKHYPLEFAKKYGQENFLSVIDLRQIDTPSKEREYIRRNVELAGKTTGNKIEFERFLKHKGIKIEKNNFRFRNSFIVPERAVQEFNVNTIDILSAYYLVKKFNKQMQGKGSNIEREEREKENDQ